MSQMDYFRCQVRKVRVAEWCVWRLLLSSCCIVFLEPVEASRVSQNVWRCRSIPMGSPLLHDLVNLAVSTSSQTLILGPKYDNLKKRLANRCQNSVRSKRESASHLEQ